MEEILGSAKLSNGASIHVATLSRATVDAADASHLGYTGYFVFESTDAGAARGISILGKATSLEAAFRLIDLWRGRSITA